MRFVHRESAARSCLMTFTPTLYFSPGSVSMATHFALEELGAPYHLEPILIRDDEQRSARYLAVHPLGRLPALEVAPGVILTETPALLSFIAEQDPERELLPRDPLLRARADEWMSLLASAVHVSFLTFYRPARYTADASAAQVLKRDGREHFSRMLAYVESRLPEAGYVLGETFSLCDAYLTVFFLWARRFEFPLEGLPRYTRVAEAVLSRPAIARALAQEGFGQA